MKNKLVFSSVIGLALILGILAVSCGSSGGNDTAVITPDLTFSCDSEDIVIVFKEAGGSPNIRAVTELADGTYDYEIFKDGKLILTGTVTLSGTTLTFTCSYDNTTQFIGTISGDTITFAGSQPVVLDDGTPETAGATNFYKQSQDGDNPFPGIWDGSNGGTVVVRQSTWAYSHPNGDRKNGTYTYVGNVANYRYSGSDTENVTTIVNGAYHIQDGETPSGITFSNRH
jgi:hypothetical protein